MGRKPTGRTTKLVRVPIKFEREVKALIASLKQRDEKANPISLELVKKE